MDMPDITLVQKLGAAVSAAATTIAAGLVVFDVLTVAQAGAVGGMVGGLVGVFVAADAFIRNGRSRALANPEAARMLERVEPPAYNGDGQ